jgi:hypothetical protein
MEKSKHGNIIVTLTEMVIVMQINHNITFRGKWKKITNVLIQAKYSFH